MLARQHRTFFIKNLFLTLNHQNIGNYVDFIMKKEFLALRSQLGIQLAIAANYWVGYVIFYCTMIVTLVPLVLIFYSLCNKFYSAIIPDGCPFLFCNSPFINMYAF